MSNQDEIDELKRIIADEKERKRLAKNLSSRGTTARRKENGKTKAHYDRIRADPELYAAHLARARERTNKHRAKNPAKIAEDARANWLKRREEVAGRPRPQECEVCNREGRVMFDHDHATGKFRGWLCKECNTTLGLVGERISVLEKLVVYLRTHGGNDAVSE